MGSDKDQDDWSFEIKDDTTKSETLKVDESVFDDTNTSVRNLKSKVSSTGSKTKKRTEKYKSLKIDEEKRVVKKSRRAIARELNPNSRASATHLFVQRYANIHERIAADLIDTAMVVVFVFAAKFFAPVFSQYTSKGVESISSFGVNSPLVAEYSWLFIAIALILIFYTIPSILYRRSMGKSMFNLYIGSEAKTATKANFIQTLFRELIFKPISICSLFGILMIMVGKNQRSLHDRLTGTSVLKV